MSRVELADGSARAAVSRRGAELRSWSVDGVPLIWTPDDTIWPETAPILFPVVGWTRGGRILVDSMSHPLGVHGFARHLAFEVVEQEAHRVRFCARASDETRASYPFDWSLEVTHTLTGPRLETKLKVANLGSRPMPYACGVHPGFCWPFAGGELDEYTIVFAERESAKVPVISPDGLFTRQTRHVPMDGRRLPLSPALMAREALCFLDARSTSLRFAHRSGAALNVAFEDFPHVAFWSRAPNRFLSIEGWTGHGDFVDADNDLMTKPSMRILEPGTGASHAASYSYVGPHQVDAA